MNKPEILGPERVAQLIDKPHYGTGGYFLTTEQKRLLQLQRVMYSTLNAEEDEITEEYLYKACTSCGKGTKGKDIVHTWDCPNNPRNIEEKPMTYEQAREWW